MPEWHLFQQGKEKFPIPANVLTIIIIANHKDQVLLSITFPCKDFP